MRAVLLLSDFYDLDGGSRVIAAALAAGLYAAGAKLMRLEADAHHRFSLKPRQLECLHWARQGKSSTVTGLILGISGRTVDEHIAHACDALGVRTRIQAVARAVMLGLI